MNEPKLEDYSHVGQEYVSVIQKALFILSERKMTKEEMRAIKLAQTNLLFHPMVPVNSFSIYVKDELGICFELLYNSESIEFQMYFTDEIVYEQYMYKCEPGEYEVENGGIYHHLYDFEYNFLRLLEELPVEEISISIE